jgi:putative zinc finger/helix-turn-helix YgiT family protein
MIIPLFAKMSNEPRIIEMPVVIPNLDGDGIAETLTVKVPITVDSETGEESLTEEAVQIIEDTKARYMGLLLPKEIRELREQLGLTQKEMSELLQTGEKSYTRWESGRARPSRMVNVLLRLMDDGKVSMDDLRSLQMESVGVA